MVSVGAGDVAPVLMLLLYGLLPAQSGPGIPPGSDIELVIRAELGRVGALSGLWLRVSSSSSSTRSDPALLQGGNLTICSLRPGMVRKRRSGVMRPWRTAKRSW